MVGSQDQGLGTDRNWASVCGVLKADLGTGGCLLSWEWPSQDTTQAGMEKHLTSRDRSSLLTESKKGRGQKFPFLHLKLMFPARSLDGFLQTAQLLRLEEACLVCLSQWRFGPIVAGDERGSRCSE